VVAPSHPRGAAHRQECCGGMRWTLVLRLTRATTADGQAVWSWRPDAGAKFRGDDPRGDGGKRARSPGRARSSRKTIAQGKPGCFRLHLWSYPRASTHLLGAHGCDRHPAFPAPSAQERAERTARLGQNMSRECERMTHQACNTLTVVPACAGGSRDDGCECGAEWDRARRGALTPPARPPRR